MVPIRTKTISYKVALLAILVVVVFCPVTRPALACGGLCDSEPNAVQIQIMENYIDNKHQQTRDTVNNHTDAAFQQHQQWLFVVYFRQYVGNAMMRMAEQFSAIALQQMFIVGSYFDAKHQLETQRLYGQLAAQAHKDYHPSEGMCSIGTAVENLAGTDSTGRITAQTLSRRSLARQSMNKNSVGTGGRESDNPSRTTQFRTVYCDQNDSNGGLAGICTTGAGSDRKNKDIDFARTLGVPLTLDINFNDGVSTPDEEDILALQTNLFATNVFRTPLSAAELTFDPANPNKNSNSIEGFLKMRSIIAKRAVAENSFQAIAAMKTAGQSPTTAQYLQAAIRDMNPTMSPAEAAQIIGDNPSYYAQMEVLTKKLIENPQFFTDLYDKPANVTRKGVALEAIGLIQDRDDFASTLRTETMLSLLLEMKLDAEQARVQNSLDGLVGQEP